MHQLRQFLSALKPTRLGVLFAVLIGIGVGFWQWGQPPRPRVMLDNLGQRAWTYFSPDEKTLAIICGEFSLDLFDIHSGQKKINLFQNQPEYPRALVFSPDGRTLAGGFLDGTIRLWNVASGQELAIYQNEHWYAGSYLVFSPQGSLQTIRKDDYALCDVAHNKVVAKLALPGESEVLMMSASKNSILVLKKGELVKVWDLATATLCAQREIPNIGEFNGVMISPDRRFLIADLGGWGPNEILIFDLVTGAKQKFPQNYLSTRGIAIAPDGQSIALPVSFPLRKKSWWSRFEEWLGKQEEAPSAYYLSLNAFPSGEEFLVLKDCSFPHFSPAGKTLAVSGGDGTLQLWDLPIRKPIGRILGLAGLAAVATLLAINGLGWLRRRRMRLKANLVPSFVPSTK